MNRQPIRLRLIGGGEYEPGSAMHGSRSRQESSSHEMARELECGPFIHLGVMLRAITSASRAGIDVMVNAQW